MAISKKLEVKTEVSKVAKPIKDGITGAYGKTFAEKTKTEAEKKTVSKKTELKGTVAKSVKKAVKSIEKKASVKSNKKAISKTQPIKKPLLPKKNKTIIISEDAEHISDDIIISELREDLSDLDFDDDDDDM